MVGFATLWSFILATWDHRRTGTVFSYCFHCFLPQTQRWMQWRWLSKFLALLYLQLVFFPLLSPLCLPVFCLFLFSSSFLYLRCEDDLALRKALTDHSLLHKFFPVGRGHPASQRGKWARAAVVFGKTETVRSDKGNYGMYFLITNGTTWNYLLFAG